MNDLNEPFNKVTMPAHIAFTQALEANIEINLSHSCGQSLSVESLLSLSETHEAFFTQDLSYSSIKGAYSLRQAIVKFHHKLYTDNSVSAEQVVTFSGAQEALSAIYHSLLQPDDEVIVFTPSYPSLQSMVHDCGAKLVPIALEYEHKWQFSWQDLVQAFSSKTKLVIINSPHNPTGMTLSEQLLKELIALCQQYDVYILLDDVSLASQYQQNISKRNVAYDKAIMVNVMSKSLGLAGIRIGWVISNDEQLMTALISQKAKGSICTSKVDEYLAELALDNSEKMLANNNTIVKSNIELFEQFIEENEGVSWHRPKAGLLSVIKLSKAILAGKSIKQWTKDFAEQTGVLLLPCYLFGLEGPYCRLGLGQKDFAQGLAILSTYIKKR